MATLALTKNYDDLTILNASDFDDIIDDLESFLNTVSATTQLNDDNIQDDGITANTILQDSSVVTANILNANVTTAKIADATIETANINDSAVTTAKIDDNNITTAKLASSSITTAKITDAIVSHTKILSNYQDSAVTSVAVTGTSAAAFTGLTKTIDVVGNRVEIRICSASNTAGNGYFTWVGYTGNAGGGGLDPVDYPIFELYRDSSLIAKIVVKSDLAYLSGQGAATQTYYIPTLGPFIDNPGAGSYTYTLKGYFVNATGGALTTITCNELILNVREL